jgi:hypothetical protein
VLDRGSALTSTRLRVADRQPDGVV